MSRKKRAVKREILPDPIFNDIVVTRFINTVMKQGKRSTAERIFYGAVDMVKEKTGQDGLEAFRKSLSSVRPQLEVKTRRVGGANYQVPVEVRAERGQALATRWIIDAARARSESTMMERLANELIDASSNRGGAIKKRDDVHKMAEANKAFSHFRW